MGKMKLLSTLDREFIHRSLGRKPSKKELNILYQLIQPVLAERELLPPQFIKQIGQTNQDIQFEIRQIKESEDWAKPSYLIRDCVLQGFWPSQISFIWLFHPTKACLNKVHNSEIALTSNFSPIISHHVSKDAPKKKSGQVILVAIMDKKRILKKVTQGQLIGYFKIPKPGKTLMNEKRILDILTQSDRFVTGFSLNGRLGDDLGRLLSIIPNNASIDFSFPEKYKKGEGIVISEGVSDHDLKRKFSEFGYDYNRIGKITNELCHHLNFGDGQEKKWPVSLTQISIHGKDEKNKLDEIIQTGESDKKIKKLKPITIIKKMIELGYTSVYSDRMIWDKSGQEVSVVEHQQFDINATSLFGGIRSVANVVRQLAIQGSNVSYLKIISTNKNSSYLAGQQSAIHSYGLKHNSHLDILNDLSENQHQIIGIGKSIEKQPIEIKESDFISLLGSVKGELADSLFEDLTGKNPDYHDPSFDSTMEYNINQALVQAVSTNVIKIVSTISKGGLMIALLNLYSKINKEFGLKIHLSRRLTSEELLFGESFGSALILIGEKELMEFQRICMSHGIPCSTIGRLHTNQQITVNDIIKIPEGVLKTI